MGTISGDESYVFAEKDAAIFLGVSVKTLQTWRSRRTGPPYVRLARKCVRYRKEDMKAFVDARVVGPERRGMR